MINEDTPTLYEWAGGADALHKLTEAFYRRVHAGELLAPLFRDLDPDHPRYAANWLGEVIGGPPAYSTQRGGHAHMVGRHLGKAITEAQRRRWVALLLDTADEVGLPDDPEFRALVRLPGTSMRSPASQPTVPDIPRMWLSAVTAP